jgi:2-polyprenyl-6-methoxyphenol hydroxylase-like FAD-dependent oxidoreductase
VTTQVRDRLTGTTYAIRSKYVVGADGARSKVAADLDSCRSRARARWAAHCTSSSRPT